MLCSPVGSLGDPYLTGSLCQKKNLSEFPRGVRIHSCFCVIPLANHKCILADTSRHQPWTELWMDEMAQPLGEAVGRNLTVSPPHSQWCFFCGRKTLVLLAQLFRSAQGCGQNCRALPLLMLKSPASTFCWSIFSPYPEQSKQIDMWDKFNIIRCQLPIWFLSLPLHH